MILLTKFQPLNDIKTNLTKLETEGNFLSMIFIKVYQKPTKAGFPGGAVVENLPANAGDTGSSPGLGRSHMPRSN